jgi:DNA-binding response OmpR family regulator
LGVTLADFSGSLRSGTGAVGLLMKILYIEDNKRMVDLVCALLLGHGYEVEPFSLGKPALAKFQEDPSTWDAAVVDLDLPDIAGQKIIAEMSALRPNLPIVVYSGVSNVKERFELYSSGASALLSKPTGAQDLLDVLKGLIELPPGPIE